ncbi:MAG: hypothetical protein HGA45_16665 [Chloroflexales bacterium]|nr:hypothetical protein [Chloroflexales bacterium]
MTASGAIVTAEHADALLVPSRAVQAQGDAKVVRDLPTSAAWPSAGAGPAAPARTARRWRLPTRAQWRGAL